MAEYNATSPYFSTEKYGRYLDVMSYRSFTKRSDDVVYQIEKAYAFRPQIMEIQDYGGCLPHVILTGLKILCLISSMAYILKSLISKL